MNNKGQSATEFVMMLPWILAFLFAFILFIVFCTRLSLFDYASFMASRVDRVWPEGSSDYDSDSQIMSEVVGLMPNIDAYEWSRTSTGTSAKLGVNEPAPYVLNYFNGWVLQTNVPIVSEPSHICDGDDTEDNQLLVGEAESCQ